MGVTAIVDTEDRSRLDPLIRRARDGDLAAFEELYRRHAGRVYGLCLRMTADPARAEELTQETFVRTWQRLASFRGDSEFGTWLRRVTVNTVLMERRARSRRDARESAAGGLDEFPRPAAAAGPGASLDLERALAGLPEGARRVFVLHDVEGYRHTEIAGMLGVTPGTSKAQLHRARRLLREALRS